MGVGTRNRNPARRRQWHRHREKLRRRIRKVSGRSLHPQARRARGKAAPQRHRRSGHSRPENQRYQTGQQFGSVQPTRPCGLHCASVPAVPPAIPCDGSTTPIQPRSKGQAPAPPRTCRRNTIARSFINRRAPRGLAHAPACAQRGFRHTGELCHFGHRLVCGAFIWLSACSFFSRVYFVIVKSIAPRLIRTPNAGLRTYMLV